MTGPHMDTLRLMPFLRMSTNWFAGEYMDTFWLMPFLRVRTLRDLVEEQRNYRLQPACAKRLGTRP